MFEIICQIHTREERHSLNQWLQHFSASAQTAKLGASDKTNQLKQDEGFIFGMLTFLFVCSTFFDWLSENRTFIWQQLACWK